MTPEIIMIPFRDLKLSAAVNARKAETDVESLAKSIATHGLLMPLMVTEDHKIVAGSRRYRALKHNKTDGAEKIPCMVLVEGKPIELSMIENVDREGLHPVDRFEVFAALVEAGETVETVARRYSLTIPKLRQVLALGRMAPVVRDAWREGAISADAAEAFTLTVDHKAQAAALKKAGKNPSDWQIKKILVGADDVRVDRLLTFVTPKAYEAAGFDVNQTLFGRDDFEDKEEVEHTVSDLPALQRLADEKLAAECDRLKEQGWKWAILKSNAPKDVDAWKRTHGTHFTKEQMAGLGCLVSLSWEGKLEVERGIVKPGDKGVSTPKSPREKQKEQKAREEKKEATGGISDALGWRLSKQITAMLAEGFRDLGSDDIMSFAIAALACAESPMQIKVALQDANTQVDDPRYENDFVKYYKLASGKTARERVYMLADWVARSIDASRHHSTEVVQLLHPDKDGDKSVRTIAHQIGEKVLLAAARKHFDAADYFNSVSKALIDDAVKEALGKEHLDRVSKMKAAEAKAYAIKHVPKTGWVPESFRL